MRLPCQRPLRVVGKWGKTRACHVTVRVARRGGVPWGTDARLPVGACARTGMRDARRRGGVGESVRRMAGTARPAGATNLASLAAAARPASTDGAGGAAVEPASACAEAPGAPARTQAWTCCDVNCGSRCPLLLELDEAGRITRVRPDASGPDAFGPGESAQFRPCVRGYAYADLVQHPDRLTTPLRRVAGTKRGQGVYEPITWDEAISEIAASMLRVRERWGNDAFYIQYGTGRIGGTVAKSCNADQSVLARLMNLFGGYLRHYGDYSTAQINEELPLFCGDAYAANEVTDLVNSRAILLFGDNPANTRMSGSSSAVLLAQVRERNPAARVYVIDPILTDTAVGLGARWVPIRPGTDAALVAGMLHHLLTSGRLDRGFLSRAFVGFTSEDFAQGVRAAEPPSERWMGFDADGSVPAPEADASYEAYLMGRGAYAGRGERDARWASEVTGVPAATICELAEACADGPAAVIQGWGPQRHANGGCSARAIALLAAATGNVGVAGGGTGAREAVGGPGLPFPKNIPTLAERSRVDRAVSMFGWYRAIEDWRSMNDATWGVRLMDARGRMTFAREPGTVGLRAPVKFIWNYASNVMAGQHGDINEMLRLYNLPDGPDAGLVMVVTVDLFMTPTARVSDIVLPGTASCEEWDIARGHGGWCGFAVCERPVHARPGQAKSIYEICCMLAERLGLLDEFSEGRTQRDWVEWLYEQAKERGAELPETFEEFARQGIVRTMDAHEPAVATRPERLATPSGRWEAFSKQAYNLAHQWDATCGGAAPDDGRGEVQAIPAYYAPAEGAGDDAAARAFPLQLVGQHQRGRTHSTYGNVEVLRRAFPQRLWLSTRDARELGVADEDLVEVESPRGRVRVRAKVTPRIMPGVASLPQGAWYAPESCAPDAVGARNNVDAGGCVSVLTSVRPTPLAKGNGTHTCRVRVRRVGPAPAGAPGLAGASAPARADRARRPAKPAAAGRASAARVGFYLDAARCIGCQACAVACAEANGLADGEPLRRVLECAGGTCESAGAAEPGAVRTDAFAYYVSATCVQCADAACVRACPTGAMAAGADGVVRVARERCVGCGRCADACPDGHPRVDVRTRTAVKCELCGWRTPADEPPACSVACPVRALEFSPLEALAAAHPQMQQGDGCNVASHSL